MTPFSGGSGTDSIFGGAGDDTLFTDAGLNTITGGAGSDQFIRSTKPWVTIQLTS